MVPRWRLEAALECRLCLLGFFLLVVALLRSLRFVSLSFPLSLRLSEEWWWRLLPLAMVVVWGGVWLCV